MAFRFRRRSAKYISKRAAMAVMLGVRSKANFDLQVPLMLSAKFRANWPFSSGEETQKRFPRWRPWLPSWISDRNDFSSFFYLQVTLMLPTKFLESICLSVQEKKQNNNNNNKKKKKKKKKKKRIMIFKMAAILNFRSE